MKNSKIYMTTFVIILFAGFCSCNSTSSNTPGMAVTSLYEKMKNNEFDKVAKMYVTKDGKQLSNDETKKLEGMVGMGAKEFDKKGGLDKVTINEEKISEDGNSAQVDFTIHFKNGKTDNENVSLIKVNGNWVIKIIG
ncbi:DUF4878 domain-containing protein [uncultured Lutibacter sp.]|uniref:DUF4878 domain-containing protein n=1 Tax=uncultured Lutibacter sp. TaxID=437739 RepID=UPI00260931F8|nr:DUF4878 domain-containing protein [uncultured Lutibacter sp.]